MKSIIRNFIAKMVAGRSDDGIMITLKDPKKVDFQGRLLEDLLMRNGIDPNAIKSEEQLKNILNQIKAAEAQAIRNTGIRNTESAKVFDMEGKEIPKGSKIMGGQAVDDLPPPGSRGGPDDIAAPVQSQEETLRNMTEAEIKKEIEAQNRSAVEKILKRKNREDVYGLEDYDTINMSEIKKQIIRLEARLGNLNPNLPGFRDRARVLSDEIIALKNKMRDDKADGGRIGLKIGTGKRFLQKVFGKEKFEEMKSRDPEMYIGLLEIANMYRKRDKEGLKMYLQKFLPHMDDTEIEAFIKGSDGTEGLIGELIRLGSGRDYAGKLEMMKRANEMRKLDDLEVTEDMIRKPNAYGGRIGLKEGISSAQLRKMRERLLKHNDQPLTKDTSILRDLIEALDGGSGIFPGYDNKNDLPKEVSARDGGIMRLGFKDGMNRRTFLKLLGGFASIPIVGKIFKPLKVGKTVTKVPIIKTDNVPGKPEWFDQLVNKVIIEGDDVTKKLSTKDREVIHTKKLNDTDEVTVYQDLETDSIRVEYNSPQNMLEEPVDLTYTKTLPDEGAPKGSTEFEATETGFVGRANGPDDFFIDAEEVGGQSIKSLESDVSALKEYATGKGPTMKEFIQNKKRKDKVKKLNEGDLEAQSDYIVNRQGDAYDYDDYASGGIAGMLGE